MASFADFKNKSRTSIEDLSKKIEDMGKKESYKDDRYWRPELDKASNGYAVIRFLPATGEEEIPWVKLFSHGFKGPGGWYIENSRTTLGEKDPVSEMNSKLWNSGIESDKDIARARKRRQNYISNILVVSDPANPQNEGKVFLYKFGKKIFEKIQEAMQPEFQDESPVNPFDFWKGANFKLKVRKVSGFVNYDKSEFDTPTPVMDGDDEQLEKIWNQQYSLTEIVDPKNFKSYDELNQKMHRVVGDDIRATETVQKTAEVTEFSSETKEVEPDEKMDNLSYFEKLANDND
tara:strand:+ start:108 stop:977 length:870 start_codon:yes stop_codon:yes gene_type:complete